MNSPRAPRRRKTLLVIVLALILLGGGWLYHEATADKSPVYKVPMPDYAGNLPRWKYQKSLDTSPDRFEPEFDVVRVGTEAWLRMDADAGYCNYRCGTLRRTPNGIEVALPVGYIHGEDVSPFPQARTSITRLTYWDEESHQVRTIVRGPEQVSVELPDSIRERRSLNELQRGKTAYVNVEEVRSAPDGRMLLNPEVAIRYEPLGEQFMRTEDALIVKRPDGKGIVVVLPRGYRPKEGNIDWMPIDACYAATSPVVPPIHSTMQV